MSMEIHVFFRGKLPGTATLTRTFEELGFQLSFVPPHYSLEGKRGNRPMLLRDEETGVEFHVEEGRKAIAERVSKKQLAKIDPSLDRCASFRFGGGEDEMACSMCCAATLAKLVKGIVFEEQDGVLWSIDQAIAEAKKLFDSSAKKGQRRPGTTTADIKRYLKPLLEKRDDLVLVGRSLLIRPVRHLLRGAVLDRTSNKYRFRVYRYMLPLWGRDHLGYSDALSGPDFEVWQPYFEPMLIDRLREEVFEQVGRVTTLEEFAATEEARSDGQMMSFILTGHRDRAEGIFRQIEADPRYDEHPARKERLLAFWNFFSRDIKTVCAELHAREAENAKAMKIEHIWEPSPFPVEVPRAQRANRTAEPAFSTMPWIERPPTLFEAVPETRGEVKFARDRLNRDGRLRLLAPISLEEAKDRHRALESYVLATRLSDDTVLVFRQRTSFDRNEPPLFSFLEGVSMGPPSVDIGVEFWGPSLATFAWASQNHGRKTGLDLDLFRVVERHSGRELWRCSFLHKGERSVEDQRGNDDEVSASSRGPLAPQERKLLRYTVPRFGEYAEFVEQVLALIRHAGSWVDTEKGADLAEYLKSLGDNWRAGRDSNP